ncbi:hypothetical protein PORY_001565 [Pneumocystis oryctolagi]|uniref:Uncharacterized protein n=1 Tax=Pneumocystis oryctolagi TaxID=42067 RepID=A0ACB7CBX0_9ASCO|nr:hypothetical protein PORY_001565 [Pneumocystis oryctolagi]
MRIKQANWESLQRVTLAALRLRGVTSSHKEFKRLMEQTMSAALFAWRDHIRQGRIPLDAQQWVVERLVGTFFLEEMPCVEKQMLNNNNAPDLEKIKKI